jgi:hypothetical protein
VAGFVEVKESFQVAVNASQPMPYRLLAGVRASCCSVSLISFYFARAIRDPKVSVAFKVCSGFASAGYLVTGGDTATALCLIVASNKTTSSQKYNY